MLPDISKFTSRDDIASLIKHGGVGVELGVAEGKFSEKLLRKSLLSHLYSIDMYAGDRGHDDAQYDRACKLLEPYSNSHPERNEVKPKDLHGDSSTALGMTASEKHVMYRSRNTIIRKTFDEALLMFSDEYFDFIYIDGYAHTGQEEGKTMSDWFPKLKAGGIISGDDYSEKWPKVIEQVDKFISANRLKLHIIKDWNGHHTWFALKD